MAALAAVAGTAVIFGGAYLIEKAVVCAPCARWRTLPPCCRWRCPALVLGLRAHVFFINARWNPLGVLYGSILLLAINGIAPLLHHRPRHRR